MKKILGLDLGVASIGWALISETETQKNIIAMGSRIIPLSPDDKEEFSSGNKISKNQKRTLRRTQRKGYDRYQLRKKYLKEILTLNNMMPNESLFKIKAEELYGLRDRATREPISLQEFGRILFHLNQKRGYKSSRKDQIEDSKETDYVKEVNGRYDVIREKGITVGQYFFQGLKSDRHYKVKTQIFPRMAYMEEFNLIWNAQQKYYPNELTQNLKIEIGDKIIYYQRQLKSQKGLVSVCEFEGNYFKNKEGKDVFSGPKVAPRSSPLFQVEKIWESINNIRLKNRKGEEYPISIDQKKQIFDYLNENEKLSQTELFKILGLGKSDGYYGDQLLYKKGIQGNITKCQIADCLEGIDNKADLLQFVLCQEEYELTDINDGEIVTRKRITHDFEKQPLYKLWHLIYSVSDEKELINALARNFNLEEPVAQKLAMLDFTKGGFSNKSAKAIRNLIPYLEQGNKYSNACVFAGYNHSDSLTNAENLSRKLLDTIPNLAKNSLRQPIVEKILNQMINVVNAIINEYGKPDEIRVELARQLKQSREERNSAYNNNSKRERDNKKIADRLSEYELRSTRKNIEKWRLYEEIDETGGRLNACCLYCGVSLGFTKSISGTEVEVEHIIPRSRLFDDSFQNKTLAHTSCNSAKGNMTAYDFMQTKSEVEFESYLNRVDAMFKAGKISKAKRDKLLMPADKIPQDFIARQLRETQYISRKSREILMQVCHHVHATSGSVTEYLRHQWGWNDVLMNLQIDKYRLIGLTEMREVEENGKVKQKEFIKGWSKRDDQRHHAIDALTVACTTPSFIKRLNDLNQLVEKKNGESKHDALKSEESLKSFVQNLKPFTTKQIEGVASKILISYKSGKKVASRGIRKTRVNGKVQIVQRNIIVPRGALSEESVYGKNQKKEYYEVKISTSFNLIDKVADKKIKTILLKRLEEFGNDPSKAFKGLKSNPIWLDSEKTKEITSVLVWKNVFDYVIKYPVQNLGIKDVEYIVDATVRRIIKKRLEEFKDNSKEAFKDLEKNPVWYNETAGIKIKTVRLFTALNSIAPIKVDRNDGNGTFVKYVKPGNNHHVAIYEDGNGKKHEHIVSFWHAVERVKRGIPIIIKKPKEVWDKFTQRDETDNDFLANLPEDNWEYMTSLQQNEMFVFGMSKEELEGNYSQRNYDLIGEKLFRVRKLTSGNYWFNQQFETEPKESLEDKKSGRCIQASVSSMAGIKVRLNPLGEIIQIGE